jgi:ubiquinone/menaquinone biosynthesis C-methylase UbiE
LTLNTLRDSWSGFSADVAAKYLKTYGSPSIDSKLVLADVLRAASGGNALKLIELGCGNGQLAEFFAERGLVFDYTGVDFSEPLLAAGRKAFAQCANIRFVNEDVHKLSGVTGRFDFAIYSHVIEMLSSPEASLAAAKLVAEKIAIRFFEPPEAEHTQVELLNLDVGNPGSPPHPYIRWQISRDYYRLMLANLGVTHVDVYRTRSKDQVHILNFS